MTIKDGVFFKAPKRNMYHADADCMLLKKSNQDPIKINENLILPNAKFCKKCASFAVKDRGEDKDFLAFAKEETFGKQSAKGKEILPSSKFADLLKESLSTDEDYCTTFKIGRLQKGQKITIVIEQGE